MTTAAAGSPPQVRRFHAILLWPLQLVSVEASRGTPPWEVLESLAGPWRKVRGVGADLSREQQYSEFVSFLPYVQRCLYGEPQGSEGTPGQSPIRILQRDDIATARLTFERGSQPIDFAVESVQLYFFFDVEIVVLALEIRAEDLPLPTIQDTLFRFGRAFPAFWNTDGRGGHCLERVEWISSNGAVLATSDFEQRDRYLRFVAEHRTACIASHWEYLLEPLVGHDSDKPGPLALPANRVLPACRGWPTWRSTTRPPLAARPLPAWPSAPLPGCGHAALLGSIADGLRVPLLLRPLLGTGGRPHDTNTRYLCSGHAFAMVGSANDPFFVDPEGGLLGQFRHQYARLGLLSHFHRASLLMLSDRLVLAISRLNVRDVESVKIFKRVIRRTMETFLRFTHRYWFHEVSTQDQARALFRMWASHLGTDQLFAEVREEVKDMNDYLDSDSLRRQANTVVRLTVVTALGLIGTVATGILGMNLFAYADQPWLAESGDFCGGARAFRGDHPL